MRYRLLRDDDRSVATTSEDLEANWPRRRGLAHGSKTMPITIATGSSLWAVRGPC